MVLLASLLARLHDRCGYISLKTVSMMLSAPTTTQELGVDDLVWIGQMGSDQAAAVVSGYAPDILIDAYGLKKRHSFEVSRWG